MKLNNKGYMLVEIIVSFSLAFAIVISLTNLVLKFKDLSEDLYYETKYLKDKNLITRNIMNELDKGTISNINLIDSKTLTFTYEYLDDENKSVEEIRKLEIYDNNITYGKYENNSFITNDLSYYTKTMESSLEIKELENCSNFPNYFCIKIKVDSIYSDLNYDLTFFSTKVKS